MKRKQVFVKSSWSVHICVIFVQLLIMANQQIPMDATIDIVVKLAQSAARLTTADTLIHEVTVISYNRISVS